MKIAFSYDPNLVVDSESKDIIFDLAGRAIYARGVKYSTESIAKYRPIYVNGTLALENNDTALNIIAGTNISIIPNLGNITISVPNVDGIYINKLTDYVKASTIAALTTTDSLNIALGKLEHKTDLGITAYELVAAANNGDTIDNLQEILKVLEGIKDTSTIQQILGNYILKTDTIDWSKIINTPITLAGYGITDFVIENPWDNESFTIDDVKYKAGIYRLDNRNLPDTYAYGNAITLYGGKDTYAQIYASYNNIGNDGLWWRGGNKTGTETGWRKVLDSGNFSSYALPLNGGGRITLEYGMTSVDIKDWGVNINVATSGGWDRSYGIGNEPYENSYIRFGAYGEAGNNLMAYISVGAQDYNSATLKVYPTYATILDSTIIHTGNIGSQSVSYATSAGSADNATKWNNFNYQNIVTDGQNENQCFKLVTIRIKSAYTNSCISFDISGRSKGVTHIEVYPYNSSTIGSSHIGSLRIIGDSSFADKIRGYVIGKETDSSGNIVAKVIEVWMTKRSEGYDSVVISNVHYGNNESVTVNATEHSSLPTSYESYVDATMGSIYGSITKLTTPRTIWGQSFDGSGNVSGNITLPLGYSLVNPSGQSAFMVDGNGYVQVGHGTVDKVTYINGSAVTLRYGSSRTMGLHLNSSGNVTIGSSDLAGTSHKLYVAGDIYTPSGMNSQYIELNSKGELQGYGGFIDFHFNGSSADYTSRIIEKVSGKVSIVGNAEVEGALSATGNISAQGNITTSYGSFVGNLSGTASYATSAGNADTLDGRDGSEYTYHVEGASDTANRYVRLAILPKSADYTNDSVTISGTIGGWEAAYKSSLHITVGRRSGVVFKGYSYPRNQWDIYVNDYGEVLIYFERQYSTWDLSVTCHQATFNYNANVTPIDTNFNKMSDSSNVVWFNDDGSVTKITPRTIWGQSFDGTGDVSGTITTDSGYGLIIRDNGKLCVAGYHGDTSHNSDGLELYSVNGVILSVGGTAKSLAVNSNGNVLIGTTTDSGQKLQVNGNSYVNGIATASGFKTPTGTNDYVLLAGGGTKALSILGLPPYLKINDIRSTNHLPNASVYPDYSLTAWFNDTGTPTNAWYSGITLKGWSSGYTAWQLAGYSDTGAHYNLYFRPQSAGSDNSWAEWEKLLTNKPTATIYSGTANLGSYWCKVASVTIPCGWDDYNATIVATRTHESNDVAIIHWNCRTNGTATATPTGTLIYTGTCGIGGSFRSYNSGAGNTTTFELWADGGGQWCGWQFTVLSETNRGGSIYRAASWYNTSFSTVQTPTYSNYITASQKTPNPSDYYWANVKVSPSSNSATSPTFSHAIFNRVSDHGINVGTIRGMQVGSRTGEFIHMCERVHIGSPSGWGSYDAPSYGLSTYGGAWLATNTGNVGIGTTNPTSKLHVSGNLTIDNGSIYYQGSHAIYPMIKFIDNVSDGYGNGIAIGGGGLTIVGSGESSDLFYTAGSGGGETLILSSDETIVLYSNCQEGTSKAKSITLDTNGYLNTSYIHYGGHEKNNSNPSYVAGFNASDGYIRSYATSSLSVNYANSAGWASSAGNADTVDGYHLDSFGHYTNSKSVTNSSGSTWYAKVVLDMNWNCTTHYIYCLPSYNNINGWFILEIPAWDNSIGYIAKTSDYNGCNIQAFYYCRESDKITVYLQLVGNSSANCTVYSTAPINSLTSVSAPSYSFVSVSGKSFVTNYTVTLSNRLYLDEWIQFNNRSGLYWPNYYGAHFYPNDTSTYGQFRLDGSKNDYSGIHFGTGTGYLTVMDNGSDKGAYQENWGWLWYFNARNGKFSVRTSSDFGADINLNGSVRTNSTYYGYGLYHLSYGSSTYALTSDGGAAHIGSMSVNYANSAGWASSSANADGVASTGYGNDNFTYYQTSNDFFGNSGWTHYLIANHGDGETYYNFTIGLPFWGVPIYKRLEGGTANGWHTFITSENISSQSVNYAAGAGNADTVDGVHLEWAGSLAASDTLWIAGWSNDGTKLKAVSQSSLSVSYANSANSANYVKSFISDSTATSRNANSPTQPIMRHYGSTGSSISNMPTGWLYGGVLTIETAQSSDLNTNLNLQLAWDVRHNVNDVAGYLWIRTKDELRGYRSWERLALMSDLNNYLPLSGGKMDRNTGITWDNGYYDSDAVGSHLSVLADTVQSNSLATQTGYGYQAVLNIGGGGVDSYKFQLASYAGGGNFLYYRGYNGNSNVWENWVKIIHSGNIGSQSVNYANSSGYATNAGWASSAGNADTVDGEHSSAFAHIGTYNNLTHSGNEFTFASSAFSGVMWINYRTASGNTDGNIIQYNFGDGKGGCLAHISNGYFSGTASYANSSGNADTLDGVDSTGFLRYYNSNAAPTNVNIVNTPSYVWTVSTTGGSVATATKPYGIDNAWGVIHLHTHIGNYATQLGFGGITGRMYMRNAYNTGTFGNWEGLAFTSDLSSYATSSALNNLGDALDVVKATYLPLSGGTMTGTITTPGDDSVVIKPAKNNYDQIGASDCVFWKIHATTFIGSLSGNASSASKLNTNNGTSVKPVYFSGGVPVTCSYEIGCVKATKIETVSTTPKYLLGVTANGYLWTYYHTTAYVNSNGVFWSSDRRLKDNIKSPVKNGMLNDETGLIRKFTWKDSGNASYGFIAQELMLHIPEAVDYDETLNKYSVNYDVAHSALIAQLVIKIKELESEISKLKQLIN